jgi:hypothetical protein
MLRLHSGGQTMAAKLRDNLVQTADECNVAYKGKENGFNKLHDIIQIANIFQPA